MRSSSLSSLLLVSLFATACSPPEPTSTSGAPQGGTALPQAHPPLEQAVVVGEPGLPQGHPPLDAPAEAILPAGHVPGTVRASGPPLRVPDEVRRRWSAVRLAVTDPAGIRSEVSAVIGTAVALPDGTLRLRADPYLPAYMSDSSGISSSSNEPENPAVLVALLEGDQVIDEGWVFRDWPQFNTFAGDRLRVELLGADLAPGADPSGG